MDAVAIAVIEMEISEPTYEVHQYAVTTPTSTHHSTSTSLPSTTNSASFTYPSDAAGWEAGPTISDGTVWYTLVNSPSSSSYRSSSTSSVIPSPSSSYVNYSSAYNNGYITSNQTVNDSDNANSTSQSSEAQVSAGSEESSSSLPVPVKTIAAVVGAAVAVVIVITIWVCCKKRQRARRSSRLVDDERTTGSVMRQRPSTTITREQGQGLTRDELYDVIPLPPPLARYSRIAPQLPTRSALNPPLITSRSNRLSSVTSSWADDSEIDALATDGSTIARTISTHSISSRISEGTVTGTASDNPFDHPAYTLMSGTSRRTRITPGTSATLSSSGRTATDTLSPTYDPFSDDNMPLMDQTMVDSPISPVSPAYLTASRSHMDDIFGSPSGNDLARGATIIQHIDGGRAVPRRAALPEPERVGDGEVHIPPTYMELYPGRNGQ